MKHVSRPRSEVKGPARLSRIRRAAFALSASSVLVAGCAKGLYALGVSEDIAMAVPSSFAYDGARANFAHAIMLGTVSCTSGQGDAEDFQGALKLSLYMNELLASDVTRARYRVDAEVNFASSGILYEKRADAIVHYRLIPVGSNTPVLDETFETTDTKGWPLYERAGPVIALLFTSPADVAKIPNPRDGAARNNISMFLNELSRRPPTNTASNRS